MTIRKPLRIIRFGAARVLTRAVSEGRIKEQNTERYFLIGGE